jgi:hypothetical protein
MDLDTTLEDLLPKKPKEQNSESAENSSVDGFSKLEEFFKLVEKASGKEPCLEGEDCSELRSPCCDGELETVFSSIPLLVICSSCKKEYVLRELLTIKAPKR